MKHRSGWCRCHGVRQDTISMIQTRKLLPTDGIGHIRPTMLRSFKEIVKTTVILG